MQHFLRGREDAVGSGASRVTCYMLVNLLPPAQALESIELVDDTKRAEGLQMENYLRNRFPHNIPCEYRQATSA